MEIELAFSEQFVLRSRFAHLSALNHADPLRVGDGAETVGDDQRRAPGAQAFERVLHGAFGFRVERRRSLVEQDDRRVLQKGAGDGDALALTAG